VLVTFYSTPYFSEYSSYFLRICHKLHKPDLFLVHIFRNGFFYLRFEDMVNGESQRDPCEWAREAGIAEGYGFGRNLSHFRIGCPDDHHQILGSHVINQLLDDGLFLRVHCACRGSDKTLCGG
jgi:hypothetical protein